MCRYISIRNILSACFFCCAFITARAQDAPWSGFGIETNLLAGKVFRHTQKFEAPIPNISRALDINFTLQTYGKKDWEQRRKYPVIGIGIMYTNYGIDSVYGRNIGIYPNLQIPLIRGKKLEWTLRFGDGIGFVTRRFQRYAPADTLNNAIGSHVNDFAVLMTDLRYHVNPHLDIQFGADFTHISDASFRQPNLGVNMYGAHIGLRYYPVTSRPKHITHDLPKLKNRWLIQFRPAIAFEEYTAPQGPLFPVYLASLYASKRWLSKNKFFAGIDYSYHTSIYAYLRNNELDAGNEAAHSWKSAIFVGNEFLIGRIGIMLQIGVYIKEAAIVQDPYYEKIGGNFYLIRKETGPLKELCLTALLLTHKTVAELGEFGMGFGF